MEPIILVTEVNTWCVKITVNAKWVWILTVTQSRQESVAQGLSIELNKDKSKCSNILDWI